MRPSFYPLLTIKRANLSKCYRPHYSFFSPKEAKNKRLIALKPENIPKNSPLIVNSLKNSLTADFSAPINPLYTASPSTPPIKKPPPIRRGLKFYARQVLWPSPSKVLN
jgi:hypothetical protein